MKGTGTISGLAASLVAAVLLTGCGGGGDGSSPSPAFDLGARLNTQPLVGIDIFPGENQTIQVRLGDTLEIDSSGPVGWDAVAGSSAGIPTETGGTLVYGGVAFTETLSTTGQLVIAVSAAAPLIDPVAVTVYATSLEDDTQTARVDVVVTN